MNKHGDYPNKLAEKSGFTDLRRLMDKFVVSVAKSTRSSLIKAFDFSVLCSRYTPLLHVYRVCGSQDTAAMHKSPFEDAVNTDEATDVYEMMSGNPQDIMMITEDVYESMFRIDPECVEDLCKMICFVNQK